MNAEQILRMIMRMFGRKAINAGIKHASNRGKSPENMSPEERQQARAARQAAKRARQASRMIRRIR